jgi:glycosyltransferase involved in cell wall biosynthesis
MEELIRLNQTDQFHFLNIFGEFESDPMLNERCFLHNYACGPIIPEDGGKLLLSGPRFDGFLKGVTDHFIRSSGIEAMLFLSLQGNAQPLKAEWFPGVVKIGILYDLIPLIFPQEYLINEEARIKYYAALELVEKMDLLLAISETTKQDAVRLLHIPPEKIVVIHAGVDPQFIQAANIARKPHHHKVSGRNPYLLYVGGVDSRKNIAKAIHAFAMNPSARDKRVRFVIAGRLSEQTKSMFQAIAQEHGAADRVDFPGYVSDEEVVELYRNAVALLFPSLYEGFGLPVLEAMCCGTVVITSNTSSLAEVAKHYAFLVDAQSLQSISDGISKALEIRPDAEEFIRAAQEYALTYRWERVAKLTREALEACSAGQVETTAFAEPYRVDQGFMEAVAQRYVQYDLPFRWPDALTLAKQLRVLESAAVGEGNRHGLRVLYDVTVLREWLKNGYQTGITRVSLQLMKALLSYAEVIPVTLKTVQGATVAVQIDRRTWQEGEAVQLRAGDIYLMSELQIREVQVAADYPSVDTLRKQGVKTYAVIYDIMPLQLPDYFETKTVSQFAGYLNEILLCYDGVLTDSKAVAMDVQQYAEAHRAEINRSETLNIGYFHLGTDSIPAEKRTIPFLVRAMFRSAEEVYLMVGTLEPRKGHALVLRAFERLWAKGATCKLCIVGRVGWMMDSFVNHMRLHPEFGRRLLFLLEANDSVLEYAYQHATALIQASENEGFGLPIIEATCYRLPVLCSDIPVFHEIAGEHAMYFSRDEDAIVRCVEAFARAKKQGKAPNPDRIEITTWQEAAGRVFSMIARDENWLLSI